MSQSEDDHRVFERFSARFPVKFKDTREEYGTKIFLRDASAEGAKLMSSERLFLHDFVSLNVKLPDGSDPLTLNGQVIWVKTVEPNQLWDVGLRFHKVDFMKVRRLFKFVEPALPEE